MTLVIVIIAVATIAYAASKKSKRKDREYLPQPSTTITNSGGADSFTEFSMNAAIADTVVIDTETINSPSGMHVIDIGAILVRNDMPIFEWEQLISPECEIPVSATLLTGITEKSLSLQPNAEQVIPKFLKVIANLTVIGHNVDYDISALNKEASRLGIIGLDTTCIDTMLLAREKFPNAPSASLQETMRLLGLHATEEHRALSDARWTFECWRRLESMRSSAMLLPDEREESRRRALQERRRKDSIFMKSNYLDGQMPTAVNAKPEGVVIETIECGVEISEDEYHQRILQKYGYDAWVWVYVVEDLIRKGKYAGYPTYWVFLDGEEIGHITKYQMERHRGQVPPEGAVMLAHVRNRKADKEQHRWQLRLQMPEEHGPVELPRQDMPKPSPAKKPQEPKPVKPKPKEYSPTMRSVTFSNLKPHKKVLAPIGRTVPIEPVDGLDVILAQFDDQSHIWVTVKLSPDALIVRLSGTILGTVTLPDDPSPFGDDARVTAATIDKSYDQVIVSVNLPTDNDDISTSGPTVSKPKKP
ncbi:PolC-type DNA polymerase III [Bifidobacterium dentium]|uniref:3'-5' exonuclease n=1 Tax=Bifidobacterium dentium TaxID=1689 RepID=UPI0018B0835C|nr:3'-5' exonuclease [Bifidobacterium dentium]MBF9694080.1 3'-5' exonuclease [Bifidobacterium dentium]